MKTIASREFQSSYQRLVEPVVVKAKSRTLGTWYPKGTEPEETPVSLTVERDGSISAISGGTLEGVVRTGPIISKPTVAVRAGVRPFSPAPKPGGKR